MDRFIKSVKRADLWKSPLVPVQKIVIDSILAGILIGMGGVVFLSCEDRVIGSVLFSFGLLTIVCRELSLYTGKIGYVRKLGFRDITITLIGNFIGTFLVGAVVRMTRSQITSSKLVETKLHDSPLSIFLLSIFCGALMYLAVDNYRKSRSWFFVILPVVIFILSGFEHCVANMFFFTLADVWHSWQAVVYVSLMIVGNAIGSWIFTLSPLVSEPKENL